MCFLLAGKRIIPGSQVGEFRHWGLKYRLHLWRRPHWDWILKWDQERGTKGCASNDYFFSDGCLARRQVCSSSCSEADSQISINVINAWLQWGKGTLQITWVGKYSIWVWFEVSNWRILFLTCIIGLSKKSYSKANNSILNLELRP